MALYEFEGKRPRIGRNSYVAETADVIGDVIIGEGAVVRAVIPDGMIAVGVPAKVMAPVTGPHKAEWDYY